MSTDHIDVVWRPDPDRVDRSELQRFAHWVAATGAAPGAVDTYGQLWRWSTTDLDGFWTALARFLGVPVAPTPDGRVAPRTMPATGWFDGTRLNYTGQVFAEHRTGDAVVTTYEDGTREVLSWAQLRAQVAAVAAFLRGAGVRPGDRVAAVLPVGPEAVVAQLATAAVGAVWSVVAPEFGEQAIVARLGQLEPVVLFTVNGYRHGGRHHDRTEVTGRVVAGLPTLRDLVWVGDAPAGTPGPARVHGWEVLAAGRHELVVEPVAFEHPLWVLFSSGTTGVPKGIVHGHGGVVLEHRKVLALHADVRAGDVLSIVGSTSWVVWTMQVSGLLAGATLVLFAENPAAPALDRVWRVAAEEGVTVLGVGAAYVHACLRERLTPGGTYDLSALQMLQVTGSPLSDDGFRWVYDTVGPVWLASMSGGTDVASIFLGGVVSAPVRSGRLQGPALGVAAAAWDGEGRPVVGAPGELVVTAPMPSMPLCFWDDPDGRRYREAYFGTWPGVWRHGDLVEFDADGSSVVLGRSDSTLNRNGIRMGSADLYRAVEAVPGVREALVVGVEEGVDYYLPLYVALADNADPERITAEIRTAIRSALSPRHLPDEIVVVRAVPHTRTGKKLEVPVKRLLQGAPLAEVVDLGAVDDADLLHEYAAIAAAHLDRVGRTRPPQPAQAAGQPAADPR